MKKVNRTMCTRPTPDLGAFSAYARDDCDGYQAIAVDHGQMRVSMKMEFDSRSEAAGRARWALGYDGAAVGHMGGPAGSRRFMITDCYLRVREDGHVKIWQLDFIAGTESVQDVEIDLSPEGFTTAFSQWQIHAGDYLRLQNAFAVLAEIDPAGPRDSIGERSKRVTAAQAVIRGIHAKWGVDPHHRRDEGRNLSGRVVA